MTDQNNQNIDKILNELIAIRRSIESVRLVLEYGDFDGTALLANRTIQRFRKLLDTAKSENSFNENFLNMVEKNRMPQLSEDIGAYASLLESGNFNADDVTERVARLEKYVGIFRKELGSMYSIESDFVQTLKSYRKPVLIGLGGFLSVILLIKGINFVRTHGHGLKAQYFNDLNLGKVVRSGIDHKIDFNWGRGGPGHGIRRDRFSIRWTGFVLAPEAGQYEFETQSDDGVRLWINDQLIIDDWNNHGVKPNRGKVELSKGPHAIKLEYYDYVSSAVVRLLWKYGSMVRPQIIPMKSFVPEEKFIS